MSEHKTLRINYQTKFSRGYFEIVKVGDFFLKSKLSEVNKILKLAQVNCSSEQQAAVLSALEEEKKEWHYKYERNHLDKCIQRIKAQTWGKAC